MSSSATLYRISNETFSILEQMDDRSHFVPYENAKSYITFDPPILTCLEFILSINQDEITKDLISTICAPIFAFGNIDFSTMTDEQKLDFFLNTDLSSIVSYLDKKTVSSISKLLNSQTEQSVVQNYDADELNSNNVYPCIWRNDYSFDYAFNIRQVLEGFGRLKSFFQKAHDEKDYILVYIG
jgi:Domain of unknown function (DUF1877)